MFIKLSMTYERERMKKEKLTLEEHSRLVEQFCALKKLLEESPDFKVIGSSTYGFMGWIKARYLNTDTEVRMSIFLGETSSAVERDRVMVECKGSKEKKEEVYAKLRSLNSPILLVRGSGGRDVANFFLGFTVGFFYDGDVIDRYIPV